MKVKSNLLPLIVVEALTTLSLWAIFSKYPIFPLVLSGDVSQYLATATSIAHGNFPSASAFVLYGAVWLYLGLVVKLFPAIPLETIRMAMGFLVFLSPLVVYFSVKELFDSRAAIWTSALYSLSGFVWFGAIFNSGLYANFVGLLSSLALIAGVVWFAKD